jgi:hypothetical protein
MFNDFAEELQKAKEETNHVAYYVYLARRCNRVVMWRDGITKASWAKRRDEYMTVARKAKANLEGDV